ncbi:5'-methylthioadenosine/S-adenosylhomocysteine nucleosidase [Devosia sp.]|uniref:5'-methylthioadenosine/S-adenosylhomocysteine nucleosidase n=1 Tax=Devosia sp. TaxID=1871048 RepID=UPI003A8E3ED5
MSQISRPTGTADILYVMAVDNEYGPELKARIDPIFTGVGPVEAAMVMTHALAKLEARERMPQYVVSLGSAGSATLPQTDVFQVSSVSYRDMDASPLGFAPGVTPFLDQPATLELGPFVPDLKRATLSTGADIVSGAAYSAIAEDMVDMETYAIKRVCQRFHVPLIALRGISDGDSELGQLEDWTRYLSIIDGKLAHAIDLFEDALARKTLV